MRDKTIIRKNLIERKKVNHYTKAMCETVLARLETIGDVHSRHEHDIKARLEYLNAKIKN